MKNLEIRFGLRQVRRERDRDDCNDWLLDLDDHHLLAPTSRSPGDSASSLARFYSDPSMTPCSSSSSVSSFNLHSNSTDHSLSSQYSPSISFFNDIPNVNQTLSSSSGYESNIPTSNSSINSISDHLFLSSPDSIIMPPPSSVPMHTDRNLVEQFIDLHLQKQTSFDQDVVYSPPSSFSSTSSSFLSQAPRSTATSPVCCRKCANNEDHQQLSSDTEDDSQSTTIASNHLPSKQQPQNKRPRSLPIAIQQPKGVPTHNHDDGDEDDDDSDYSLKNSLPCHCSILPSRKKRFRTCELNPHPPILTAAVSANGLYSENTLITTTTDKLHIDLKEIDEQNTNDQLTIKQQKNSLEHFIMSPTDKVRVQMKYLSNSTDRENETRSVSVFFREREREIDKWISVKFLEWIEDLSTRRYRFQTIKAESHTCSLSESTEAQQYSISGVTSSQFLHLSLRSLSSGFRRMQLFFRQEQQQVTVILH